MDNTEDLSARVLLRNILSTEIPRTPVTRSTQAQSANETQRITRSSTRRSGSQTPQDILRRSLRQKMHESISRKSLPPPKRRTGSAVLRRTNTHAPPSMLFDEGDTPRHILKNILRTEPVKSPVIHEKVIPQEPQATSANSSIDGKSLTSIDGSQLDLSDITFGHTMSTARGLRRKRSRQGLNVTDFEKRLKSRDDNGVEESLEDASSLSLSSTSLSLKTPFVDVRTEKRGLQRRIPNRRKITEEDFGAAVNKRQTGVVLSLEPVGQRGNNTTFPEDFTFGQSKLSEFEITNDIINSNTALYAESESTASKFLQDKSAALVSQPHSEMDISAKFFPPEEQFDAEKQTIQVTKSEEDGSDLESHTEEEGACDAHTEEEAATASQSEEEEAAAASQSEEEEAAAASQSELEEFAAASQSGEEEAADASQTDGEEAATASQTEEEEAATASQSEIEEAAAASQSEEEEAAAESQSEEEDALAASQSEEEEAAAASQSEEQEASAASQSEEQEASAASQSEEEEAPDPSQSEEEEAADASQLEEQEAAAASQSEEEDAADASQSEGEEAADASQLEEQEAAAASQSEEEDATDASQSEEEEAAAASQSEEEEAADVSQSEEEETATASQTDEEEAAAASQREDEEAATASQMEEEFQHNEHISQRSHRSEDGLVMPVTEIYGDSEDKEMGEQEEDSDDEEDEEDIEEIPMKTPAFVREKRVLLPIGQLNLPTASKGHPASNTSAGLPPTKPKQTRKRKAGLTKKASALPKNYLMGAFKHFAKTKVSSDVYPVLNEIMDKFFERMADDLETYAIHAKRKTIEIEDAVLLLKRQGYVNDKVPVEVLIEKFLRMDQRKLLIPVATSGNVVVPKSKR